MAVTSTTMNGLAKKVFGDFNKAIPEIAVMQELCAFQDRAKTGDLYEELIQISRSHGFTFARTTRRTAYSLAAAVSLRTEPAQVQPSEIIGREQLAYGMLFAAEKAGEKAYAAAIGEALMSVLESHRFYLEFFMLYGDGGATPATGQQPGLGTFAEAGPASASATLTISKKSWSPGIWSQMENAKIDVYTSNLVTKRNTLPYTVTAVSAATREVTLTEGTAGDVDLIQVGDVAVPYGSKGECMAGLDTIACNTGTLMALSATTYGIWKANVIDHGALPMSVLDAHKYLATAIGRGLAGDVTILCSHFAFMDMIEDTTALRRFIEDTKTEVDQGTEKLSFHGASGGKLEFRAHTMVKAGDTFELKPKDLIRGGDSDVAKGIPGQGSDDFFFHLTDTAACEVRNFSSEFIIHKKPSHLTKIHNILPRSVPAAPTD